MEPLQPCLNLPTSLACILRCLQVLPNALIIPSSLALCCADSTLGHHMAYHWGKQSTDEKLVNRPNPSKHHLGIILPDSHRHPRFGSEISVDTTPKLQRFRHYRRVFHLVMICLINGRCSASNWAFRTQTTLWESHTGQIKVQLERKKRLRRTHCKQCKHWGVLKAFREVSLFVMCRTMKWCLQGWGRVVQGIERGSSAHVLWTCRGKCDLPQRNLGQDAAFQPDRLFAMFPGAQDRGCVSGFCPCSSPGMAAEP